jgi:glycosyltransferase involved in cell wall biosynthesis
VAEAPLVSVIINAYNVEPYLRECLDSVLAQTLRDFEAIVVNDGSTDATGKIAEAYARRDARIRVFHNERNLGIPATINRALALSRGELIAKLDADDVSMPARFEKQVAYLRAYPQVVMVGCGWVWIDQEGRALGTQQPRASNRQLAQQMRKRCVLVHTGVMVRGELVRRIGYREFTPHGVTVRRFREEEQFARYARLFARQRRRRGADDYERVAANPDAVRPVTSERASRSFYHYRYGLFRLMLRDMAGARRELWRSLKAVPWNAASAFWLVATCVPRPLLEAARRLVWRVRWGHPPD